MIQKYQTAAVSAISLLFHLYFDIYIDIPTCNMCQCGFYTLYVDNTYITGSKNYHFVINNPKN